MQHIDLQLTGQGSEHISSAFNPIVWAQWVILHIS